MRQSCCIKISDFPMRCEELRDQGLRDVPYTIIRDNRIAHVSTLAARAGVDLKMRVNLVKTIYPGVRILPYDQDLYFTIHQAFLDTYADCSPFVEPVREGEAFIDLTGVQDDVVEVRQMIEKVRMKSPFPDVYMALCSSTSKLVSRIGANLVATSSDFLQHRKGFGKYIKDDDPDFVFLVIEDEYKADFIERLPIQYLWSADEKDVSKLYQLGIKRIGNIRRIPVSVLAGQIGDSAYRIYEMSYGIDGTPVYPCYPEMELWEKRVFEDGATDLESLATALDDILQTLVKRLIDMDMTTSSLSLQVSLSGMNEGRVISHDKKLKHPTASQRYIESVLSQMIPMIGIDLRSGGSHPDRPGVSENGEAYSFGYSLLSYRTIEEVCVRFKGIQPLDAGKVDLFDGAGKREREQLLERAMLSIERRFGADTIELAGALASSRRDKLRAILDVF